MWLEALEANKRAERNLHLHLLHSEVPLKVLSVVPTVGLAGSRELIFIPLFSNNHLPLFVDSF